MCRNATIHHYTDICVCKIRLWERFIFIKRFVSFRVRPNSEGHLLNDERITYQTVSRAELNLMTANISGGENRRQEDKRALLGDEAHSDMAEGAADAAAFPSDFSARLKVDWYDLEVTPSYGYIRLYIFWKTTEACLRDAALERTGSFGQCPGCDSLVADLVDIRRAAFDILNQPPFSGWQ